MMVELTALPHIVIPSWLEGEGALHDGGAYSVSPYGHTPWLEGEGAPRPLFLLSPVPLHNLMVDVCHNVPLNQTYSPSQERHFLLLK